MAKIADTEAAVRLARAIVNDIKLYNAEKIHEHGDLSEELQEGRALYRSRTEPLLHDVYEREIASLNVPPAPTPQHAPSATAPRASTTREPTESRGNGLWIALGIGGLLALGLWRLLRPQDW